MKSFEKAVEHLKSIDGPFSLDLGVLRDGFIDLQARLQKLEATAKSSVPIPPAHADGAA